ncbi:MAG: hypothetical protein WCH52_06100 [Bacteroidota bacterium]
MKNLLRTLLFLLMTFFFSNGKAQSTQKPDSLGLPGDNLNLYAVLQLFQESETLESFERKLNAEDSKINNLDLNGDNKTDYIRVIDKPDGKAHNIVLQVPINEKENQDVAVFIVDKNDKGDVQIQLIGDEDLYGKDYIIEPNYKDAEATTETPNPGYVKESTQKSVDQNGNTTIINNYTTTQTASWPVVEYIYTPTYIVYVSPWRWSYYPSYWNPWTPWYWHSYYGYHYHYYNSYYGNYHHSNYYRSPLVRSSYYNSRSISITYNSRSQSGDFRKTYTHPETRKAGDDLYKKDKMASDRNKKMQMNHPSSKPALTNPSTTRPSNNKPAHSLPVNSRPVSTRPSHVSPSPTKPSNTRPAFNQRPAVQHPQSRPQQSTPKNLNSSSTNRRKP